MAEDNKPTKSELEILQSMAKTEDRIKELSKNITAENERTVILLEQALEKLEKQLKLEQETTELRREQIADLKEQVKNGKDSQEVERARLELLKLELKELKETQGVEQKIVDDKKKELESTKKTLETTKELKKVEVDREEIFKKVFNFVDSISGGIAGQLRDMFSLTGLAKRFGELVVDTEKSSKELVGTTGQLGVNFTKASIGLASYGVGFRELNKSAGEVFKTMASFSDLNVRTQAQLAASAAKMERLGVSASVTGKNFNELTKSLRMNTSEAMQTNDMLAQAAIGAGIAPQKMMEEFASSLPKLAAYGKDAINVYIGLQKQAKALGMEMSSLTNIVGDQFDTFEGSASAAGKLNAILGGNYLNSVDMLNASEEERIMMIKQSLEASGKSWDSLDKYQKKALAATLNIHDMNEASKFFGTSTADVSKKMDAQAATHDKLEATQLGTVTAMEKLSKTIDEQLVPAAQSFSTELQNAINKIKEFLSSGDGLVKLLAISIVGALSTAGLGFIGFKKLLSGLFDKETFGKIGDAVGGAIEKIGDSISKITGPQLIMGILAIGASFVLIGYGISIASEGLSKLVVAFKGLTGKEAVAAVAGLAVVMTGFVAIIATLGAVMIAGPGAAAAAGLLALGAAFLAVGKGIDIAADGLMRMKPIVIEVGKIIMDGIVEIFTRMYEPIVKIADIIGRVLISAFENFKGIIEIVAKLIKDTVLGIFENIVKLTEKEDIGDRLKKVGWGLKDLALGMYDVHKAAGEFVDNTFNKFIASIDTLFIRTTPAITAVTVSINNLNTSLKNITSQVSTPEFFKKTSDAIITFAASLAGAATSIMAIDAFSASIFNLSVNIEKLFNSASGKATGFGLNGFALALLQTSQAINKLSESLNNLPENKTVAIKTIADSISVVKTLKEEDLKPMKEFVTVSKEYYEVQANSKDADTDAIVAALKELKPQSKEGQDEEATEIRLIIDGRQFADALKSLGDKTVKGIALGLRG